MEYKTHAGHRLSRGAISGLIATIPMSVSMLGMHRMLPIFLRHSLPPKKITVRLSRRLGLHKLCSPRKRNAASVLSHFGYGAAAGAMYAPLAHRLPLKPEVSGTLYGLLVWWSSYFGWLPAMNILHPEVEGKRRQTMMAIAHVIWGCSLGATYRALSESKRKVQK